MNVMSQVVGNTVVQWQENKPLCWEMRETHGEGKDASETILNFDLTPLLTGYGYSFLAAMKVELVNMRRRITLKSVGVYYDHFRLLLEKCQDHFGKVCERDGTPRVIFERIDSNFLLGLTSIKNEVSENYLKNLKRLYRESRDNTSLFSPDLHPGDFPTKWAEDGMELSLFRQNIIASTMSRSVLVHILNVTEAAFGAGELNLDRYAFSRLLLSRAARPETFRVLRCKDLQVDISGGVKSYFLTLTIPKAGTLKRPQATVSLHRDLGQLLEKQREAVASRLGYLVEGKNAILDIEETGSPPYAIGDLPLFPVLRGNKALRNEDADNLGMYRSSKSFAVAYAGVLKKMASDQISFTAMRHTMATQLAIAGCSAGTIAAVLLHATEKTARVYVDLIFEGTIDELSGSMEPAFADHFPVYKEFVSKEDLMPPENRIVAHSADGTKRETTGGCGNDEICAYAPISCYDCPRFKPAYDADHTINLDTVTDEIVSARGGGLQRQNDVRRYSHIANRIRTVIAVCELKRQAVEVERANGVTA